MCGIAGELRFLQAPGGGDRVQPMLDFMVHRGPDGEGLCELGPCTLGHRRLSIIDLDRGAQPMTSACGRYTISFNGEIYNYIELREELQREGVEFDTSSDTEVLLAVLSRWGKRGIERLNGMFAFGLWDAHARRLLLVRDRLGIKPLYYYRGQDQLLFASDSGALASHPEFPRRLEPRAVSHFLTWRVVPVPYTAYKDTFQLEPGTWLEVDSDGVVQTGVYWFPEIPERAERRNLDELSEELEALLADAVRIRIRSDVPVGAFLSGGVDSSTVVHWMKEAMPGAHPLTFTIGFRGEEAAFDESEWAGDVAAHVGTDHHLHILKSYEMVPLLRTASWFFSQPCGTGLPNYFVSQTARMHVTVALAGVGGDELFAGYTRFRLGLNGASPVGAELRFLNSLVSFSNDEKKNLMTPDFFDEVRDERSVDFVRCQNEAVKTSDTINKLCWLDLRHFMLNDLLYNLDKMSMAHSLEARVPLLDHRIVEFALRVPPEAKVHRGIQKYLLKRVMMKHLPHHVFFRAKKGFSLPKQVWIPDIRTFVEELVNRRTVEERGIFKWRELSAYMERVFATKNISWHDANNLWNVFNLELWCQQFLDGAPELTPPLAGVAVE